MADLLSQTDKDFFISVLGDIFDTFKRDIVIHKEPKKKIINPAIELYAGYAESSAPANIEYIPESKTFPGLVSYLDSIGQQSDKRVGDINLDVRRGKVRIKVLEDAKEYIMKGTTEKVLLDGKAFNVITYDTVKYFFGMKWYVFYLEQTM